MFKRNISNPIYEELLKLKLISNKNLIEISQKTRDKNISVIQDKETKIIFLKKNIITKNYYNIQKNLIDKKTKLIKKGKTYVQLENKKIKTNSLNDDQRRLKMFKKFVIKKDILDFGCGWGEFLNICKASRSRSGVEIREIPYKYIKKKFKSINVQKNLNHFQSKFDVITMFHVLEHIPNQVKILKSIKSKLKKNGKIFIEVPHAEDFLISQINLEEYKKFTFWSEHLILHTFKSLRTILKAAGFKKIEISFYQRYGLSNHLGWFIKKKPGGHVFFKNLISKNSNRYYSNMLKKLQKTDTLIASAIC